MPRKPAFKFFAIGECGDIFGWYNKSNKREYSPKTAVRLSTKNIKIKKR